MPSGTVVQDARAAADRARHRTDRRRLPRAGAARRADAARSTRARLRPVRAKMRRARAPAKRCGSIASAAPRGCRSRSASTSWPSLRRVRGSCSPARVRSTRATWSPCRARSSPASMPPSSSARASSGAEGTDGGADGAASAARRTGDARHDCRCATRSSCWAASALPARRRCWRPIATRCSRRAARSTREAARRVERAKTLTAPLDILRAVFGDGFLALPRFTLPDAGRARAVARRDGRAAGRRPLAVYPWFQQVQRVREPVSRLGASLHAAEAAGTGARMQLTVAQLPHTAGERWVGLPAESGDADARRAALARRACRPDAGSQETARRTADRRMGRSRAVRDRDDGDHVPARCARFARAADDAARGAAGAGRAVDGRRLASAAARHARAGAGARDRCRDARHRGAESGGRRRRRSASSRISCRRCISR